MTLVQRDRDAIWHPFTQHQNQSHLQAIVRGAGAYVFDEQGKRYLDLISSWWVNLHGHCHPEIAAAIYQQAQTLEHVIFSGFTHEPAVCLAEKLLQLLPPTFNKIFYSDNGSTAVEIAIKMAFQFWQNQGETQRTRFIAFENGYHGDTFGAMAVGKHSGFFGHFEKLFFAVDFFPYPATWMGDHTVEEKEHHILQQLETYLERHGKEVAALIIEPLVQGAGGMNMCRPQFLQKLETLLHAHDVLIIYDEVMTGFGRTGDLFACTKASTTPDIICLAKGLTGGFLPLAVTACQEKIYQAFLGENFNSAFAHGHSFTANPLGCAAGLASMKLLVENFSQLSVIEAVHAEELTKLAAQFPVAKPRYCGTIAAFDLTNTGGYGSELSLSLRNKFFAKGLLIRPLGNVIYLLPPYCVNEQELRTAYAIIAHEIEGVLA